jgi:MerR family transcriptional regulator, light-induced transcriptional regulator
MKNERAGGEAKHPIGVVAERTGLSQEVLRVWERRYGVVEPSRGKGGQRLYSDADVEKLRLLRQATQGGRGIGQVAGRSVGELTTLVREDEEARATLKDENGDGEAPADPDLGDAMRHARELDAERLERLLRRTAALAGAPRFLERTVAPFLQRIGDEWHAGRMTVAQEHLATGVVQRVVISVLESLSHPDGAPVLLIAGPAGDRHEMGGLLATAVAASEGWRVIYLGPDLPAAEIVDAAKSSGADAVGLSVVYVEDRERTIGELSAVRELLPASVPLLVGGGGAAALADALEHPGTRIVGDLGALRHALRARASRSRG